MAQDHTHTALNFLANRQLTPLTTMALRVVVLVAKWEERRKTRKALKRLDTHLLRDIGMTPRQARVQFNRRFWQG